MQTILPIVIVLESNSSWSNRDAKERLVAVLQDPSKEKSCQEIHIAVPCFLHPVKIDLLSYDRDTTRNMSALCSLEVVDEHSQFCAFLH